MMNLIKQQLDNRKTLTENGALQYATSGHELLDLNFMVSSLRKMPESKIKDLFIKAYFENPTLAVRWLFYLRDIRGGLGERRSFRIMFDALYEINPAAATKVSKLIPEYGRWDDYYLSKAVDVGFIHKQLSTDVFMSDAGESITLLAKWMPSLSTKNPEKKAFLKRYLRDTNVPRSAYAKMLSHLRGKLDVVEKKQSANKWGEINYNGVPARANLIYNNAFLRHDETRRRKYLEDLSSGKEGVKINAGTLFPCDIVRKYTSGDWYSRSIKSYDETLEQLWKALPNVVPENGNVIVVADGSGSMTVNVGGNNMTALSVANSLAIYFAERLTGPYKNKYITFSSRPQFVDFSNAKSLRDKLEIARRHNEVANTNIKATFDLILQTACEYDLDQSDLPSTVMIVSDMEFDSCGGRGVPFNAIAADWALAGYKLPKLVFWNVNGRTGGVPMQQNENGVVLLSGFSQNTFKMAMNNEIDPYKALVKTVMSPRYNAVEEALNN